MKVAAAAYEAGTQEQAVAAGATVALSVDTRRSVHRYDVVVRVDGHPRFQQRFAGRVETGEWGSSDPAMA